MHLTCPIRQDKGGDGYGTEASKVGANPAYSTGNTELVKCILLFLDTIFGRQA
jgi:hypothetical protein